MRRWAVSCALRRELNVAGTMAAPLCSLVRVVPRRRAHVGAGR